MGGRDGEARARGERCPESGVAPGSSFRLDSESCVGTERALLLLGPLPLLLAGIRRKPRPRGTEPEGAGSFRQFCLVAELREFPWVLAASWTPPLARSPRRAAAKPSRALLDAVRGRRVRGPRPVLEAVFRLPPILKCPLHLIVWEISLRAVHRLHRLESPSPSPSASSWRTACSSYANGIVEAAEEEH